MKYLDLWHALPVSYSPTLVRTRKHHYEQHKTVLGSDPGGTLFHLAADRLMRYRLYPPSKLSFLGDFDLGGSRWMAAGDRAVHRLRLLTVLGKPALDLVGMVEISQIITEPRSYGFTAVTVAHHLGVGEMSAKLSWTDNHDVLLTIDVQSCRAPGESARKYRWIRRRFRKIYLAGLDYFKNEVLGAS